MADKLPEFENQVKLQPTLLPQGIGQAAAKFAASNTFLGDLGAKIAQTSSNAINTQMGYEAGLNPDGSNFIPITDADKVWKESYDSASSMKLSSDFQQLSLKAQAEVNKLDKITDESQAIYLQTMTQGMEENLNLAPASIRGKLKQNYESHLALSVSNIENKKIEQDKAQAKSQTIADNRGITTEIYDQGYSGHPETSIRLNNESLTNTDNLVKTGGLTPVQKETIDSGNRISMWSGIFGGKAESARVQERSGLVEDRDSLGRYLDSLQGTMDGLKIPPQEQQAITSNVMSSLKNTLLAKEREDTSKGLTYTQNSVKGLTLPTDIAENYENMPTVKAQALEIADSKRRNSTNSSAQRIQNLVANPTSQAAYLNASTTQQNQAFNLSVSNRMQSDGISLEEARIQMGGDFSGPVKINIDTINSDAHQKDSSSIQKAITVYDGIQKINKNNTVGVTQDTIERMESYKANSYVSSNPQLAANQVYEDFDFKSKDQQEAVNKGWRAALAKNIGSTIKEQNSATEKAMNDATGKTVMNIDFMRDEFLKATKTAWSHNNMNFTAAWNAASQKMKQTTGFDTTWSGTSNFPDNLFRQKGIITNRPIQDAFGVGPHNPGLMQTFIVSHAKNIFDNFNSISDTTKFRMIKRKTNLEEAGIIKENLDLNPFFPMDSPAKDRQFNREEEQTKYDHFLHGQNIEFDIIDKNQVRSRHTIYLVADDTISERKDGTIKGWNLWTMDSKGASTSLSSLLGKIDAPSLQLNKKDVWGRYIKHVGTGTPSEKAGQYIDRSSPENFEGNPFKTTTDIATALMKFRHFLSLD